MALIKCNHCGKMVSDRAVTCPHCGSNPKEAIATTQEVLEKEEVVKSEASHPKVSNSQADSQAPQQATSVAQEEKEDTSSGASKTLVGIVIVLAIIAISVGGYLLMGRTNSNSSVVVPDTVASDTVAIDSCASDTTEEVVLKYSNIPDRLRMNLIGKVKKIALSIYDPRQDPNEMGHGLYDWACEFDTQGMLKTCSTEHEMYGSYHLTLYYAEGKLLKMSGERSGYNETYKYEYRQADDHTVNVMQINSEGNEELAMVLSFYDNGNLKEKRILTSLIYPYTDCNGGEFVVKYNSDGVEIDNRSYWGHLTEEKKDDKGNWIERTYENGLSFSRSIEYF